MDKLTVGFTGTKEGMTDEQFATCLSLILSLRPTLAIHGDCIGSDTDFHKLAETTNVRTDIYPPKIKKQRAFNVPTGKLHPTADYLERDKKIASECNCLLATPKNFVEELRSGTWATIRYAKKQNKTIYIIYPDGNYERIGKELLNEVYLS